MKVLKFGGTSVADANCFISLAKLLRREASASRVGVVLSAPAKITNLLHEADALASASLSVEPALHKALAILYQITEGCAEHIYELSENYFNSLKQENEETTSHHPSAFYDPNNHDDYASNEHLHVNVAKFDNLVKEHAIRFAVPLSLDELKACFNCYVQTFEEKVNGLLKTKLENKQLTPHEFAELVSEGERFSVGVANQLMEFYSQKSTILNPCDAITTDSNALEATVDLVATKAKFDTLKPNLTEFNIVFMPGFFGADAQGNLTLLGRNGSDYSAALLAYGLDAQACEIYTDVDGVYTCDPRIVEDAKLIRTLSYHEAMELSYFGAKVIHPKTIHPLVLGKIPCYIKNSKHPEAPGSVICDSKLIKHQVSQEIKGITSLDSVSMFNISGPGMKGTVGIAARIFNTIAAAGVSILMITQSSSEYSIGFCVFQKHAEEIKQKLEQEFAKELESNMLDPIVVDKNLAILTVVGDQMRNAKGISSKFFTALSQTNVNIIAISQGSNERSISTVIDSNRMIESVKAVHRALFNGKQIIRAFIVGVGGVGSELINQIMRQKAYLARKNIEISICGIANSRKCLLDLRGLKLDEDWKDQLEVHGQAFVLEDFIDRIKDSHVVNPVFVDCTSNQHIADSYVSLLNAGFNIVTPNKKANTSSLEYYKAMRRSAQENQRRLMYETNVGAGLPVIENLQNLLAAGDEIVKFNGILSGSLSYIFGELETGKTLSEVTKKARELGYTEPDPRDDLSGQDVARKLLILAREAGLELELEDVNVEPVLPKGFGEGLSTEEFMKVLPEIDAQFSEKVNQAAKEGKVLRYVGSIENHKCKVAIQAVEADDPLYKVKNGENALAFYTHYYNPIPLLLRGYGAGNDVTAAGIFSDILRTLSSYSSLR